MAVLTLTDETFSDYIASHKEVIVKFYADWCGTCRLFAPKFEKLSQDISYEGVEFVQVNAESNPETRKLAQVKNLPFIASFKNGQFFEGHPTGKLEATVDMLHTLKN